MPYPPVSARRGFTLVEILIVVIILGILAAIVVPQFTSANDNAKDAAFKSSLRNLRQSARMYLLQHAELPAQSPGTPMPPVLFGNNGATDGFHVTPYGGFWHMGKFSGGSHDGKWGVGVWWPTDQAHVADSVVTIDEQLDDGVRTSGDAQQHGAPSGGRYYWLVE